MDKDRKVSIFKAVVVFLLFYLRQYFQVIPILLFHIDVGKASNQDVVVVNLFLNALLVLLLFLLYRKELMQKWQDFKEHKTSYFDTGLRFWFLGLVAMVVINVLISMLTPVQNSTNEIAVRTLVDTSPILMIITAGILAPIVEEMTFRKAIKDIIPNQVLFCIVSGVVFGLMHIIGSASSWYEYLYVLSYGALGASFAAAYVKTDNIFTSITMHAIHNTVLILLSFL